MKAMFHVSALGKTIEIDLAGKHNLTVEEARELRDALTQVIYKIEPPPPPPPGAPF